MLPFDRRGGGGPVDQAGGDPGDGAAREPVVVDEVIARADRVGELVGQAEPA